MFPKMLGLVPRSIKLKAQKTNRLSVGTYYGIVLASFLLQNSLEKVQFFEKTFLLADTNIEIVKGISFLSLSNIDLKFSIKEFI